MKHAPVHAKSTRPSVALSLQRPVTGPNGLAIAPPAYGINFVDREQTAVSGNLALDATIQRQAREGSSTPQRQQENNTGLSDHLKTGIESLSGLSLDDVRVRYNSTKPAALQALAYTQGTDIHVGPGQEKHLPHEVWHVVQQKQGRVKPTLQMKGTVHINDDVELEKEADVMGSQAIRTEAKAQDNSPVGQKGSPSEIGNVVQRKVGFEFQTGWQIESNSLLPIATTNITKNVPLVMGEGWKLTRDAGDAEFVVSEIEEGDDRRLAIVFRDLRNFTEDLIGKSSQGGPISTSILNGVTTLGRTTQIQPADPAMTANPQITAGLDLAKITEVMRQIGDTNDPNHGDFIGGRERVMREMSQTNLGLGASPEYTGFVSLMASYVYLSSSLAGYADTPKNITSLMARTNMAEAFQLTQEGKAQGSPKAKGTQLTMDVLQAARALTPNAQYSVPIHEDLRLVPPSTDLLMKTQGDMEIVAPTLRTGPTVQEWAMGIVNGKDLLSGLSTVLNVSMGSLGTEGVSNIKRPNGQYSGIHRKEGIIVEFRDLKKGIPQEIWADWAQALLGWITQINDSSRPNTGHLPKRGSRLASDYVLSKFDYKNYGTGVNLQNETDYKFSL